MKKLSFLIAALALFLASCGGGAGASLEGTAWTLVSLGDSPPVPGSEVTLVFADGEAVNGRASCNSFFGSYQTDGEALSFSALANTEMFCGEPAGLMEQETAYLGLLQVVNSYKISGSELILTTPDGRTIVFNAQ